MHRGDPQASSSASPTPDHAPPIPPEHLGLSSNCCAVINDVASATLSPRTHRLTEGGHGATVRALEGLGGFPGPRPVRNRSQFPTLL